MLEEYSNKALKALAKEAKRIVKSEDLYEYAPVLCNAARVQLRLIGALRATRKDLDNMHKYYDTLEGYFEDAIDAMLLVLLQHADDDGSISATFAQQEFKPLVDLLLSHGGIKEYRAPLDDNIRYAIVPRDLTKTEARELHDRMIGDRVSVAEALQDCDIHPLLVKSEEMQVLRRLHEFGYPLERCVICGRWADPADLVAEGGVALACPYCAVQADPPKIDVSVTVGGDSQG